jgi:hypothetical protein
MVMVIMMAMAMAMAMVMVMAMAMPLLKPPHRRPHQLLDQRLKLGRAPEQVLLRPHPTPPPVPLPPPPPFAPCLCLTIAQVKPRVAPAENKADEWCVAAAAAQPTACSSLPLFVPCIRMLLPFLNHCAQAPPPLQNLT